MSSPGDITRILVAAKLGDADAEAQLIGLVYADLHSLARRSMSRERSDHTLQPTALVNEAYLRLMRKSTTPILDRTHFFATAARVMRRVLVDHAREREAVKRGGDQRRVEFDEALASEAKPLDDWIALDAALRGLGVMDPRQARLVEIVYFGGLTLQEAATALGISERTAKRDWRAAKAWLKAELQRPPSTSAPAESPAAAPPARPGQK